MIRQTLKNKESKFKQVKEFTLEILRIIIISVAIIIPIRYYLVQPFYVKGASMEPNFYDHEYLLIDELSYRLREPVRGEIIVFRFPLDKKQYFIKRIIGLPGETVKYFEGRVYIYNEEHPEGFVLDEYEYLSEVLGKRHSSKDTINLKEDEYYVLGDNRDLSLDSREFGSVDNDLIIGRAVIRGFPFSRIDTFFESPNY